MSALPAPASAPRPGSARARVGAAPPARTTRLTVGLLERRQGPLRFLTGGSGPPLVLCHGFLGSAENFDAWLPTLLPRRTVVIPDLPGFGASAPLPGRHTAGALGREVAAVALALGHERYDLAGLCLGASVALAMAGDRPESVGSLLLHTPLLHPTVVRRRFHAQVAGFTAPGVFAAITWLAHRRWASDWYKRHLTEGEDVDLSAAQVNFDNQLRACPRAARAWLRDGLRHDFRRLVADWPRPVLLMVAADDRIVDVPQLAALARAHPLVETRVVDSAGHGWSAAFVTAQRALLAGFLDRVDGRERPSRALGPWAR